ncbi:alpha/beta-hydrolase [Gymnopilus junonius]|uniref:Alpha/beta-hydrolase n=1 Tax=Gymnopilus junonius TaxID=109634 RepID=A0A9P5N6J9_GYMJU|nr:alpha/beta-hydrolase [Gymnopilus junonius]
MMYTSTLFAAYFVLAAGTIYASPINLEDRSVSSLSATDLASLAPFTQFARAAYCPTSLLKNWNCGQACQANSDFQPTLVDGDGNAVQIFFVGFSPSQNSIIVAHEGTDPTQFLSDLTDINIAMDTLDSTLFPGVSSSVQVHQGFRNEHALTATTILNEVKRLISVKNTNKVTIVGHSLGGALSELDSLFLTLNLPSSTSISAVTYGTPALVIQPLLSLLTKRFQISEESTTSKISSNRSWSFLGIPASHGEVHIISPGNAVACSGDDDATDSQCTIESVPNIFEGNILNHLGPYQGINIGTIFCT